MENGKISTPAERIKQALQLKGMKAADLAKEAGIDKSKVSCYLSGKYEPKQTALFAIR